MLRSTLLAVSLCFAVPISGVLAGPADDTTKAEYAAWNQAFNKGDAKAVAAFYGSEALVLPPTHEIISKDGIEKFFASIIGAGVTSHSLEIIKVIDTGDTHIATAKWSAKGKDGSAIGGIATHVFQKQPDGSFKVMLHTFN